MNNYERLTEKDEEYGNFVPNRGSELNNPKIAVSYNGKIHGTIIDRLADLEDKIENGTLIQTEYPIYQDVYFIDYVDKNYYSVGAVKGKPVVRKAFIRSVEQVMKGQILYLIQPHDLPQEVLDNEVEHTETWEWFHYSKKDLFLTKEAAEVKLKELQGE